MQALMLAAGMGKRLQKYTKDQTKCMVQVAGKTLLEHTIDSLKFAGINKLIMVVGYQSDKLVSFVEEKNFDIDVEFIFNNDYDSTNNIYSLYMACDKLAQDDTILLESDLIYDVDVIKKVVDSKDQNIVVVAKYSQWMDGTVTLLNEENYVHAFIEKVDFKFDNADKYYKTVNIYKFSKEFSRNLYIPFLQAYIEAYGKNEYYELVLKVIAHLSGNTLKGLILENSKWYEIDDGQDLDIANTLFANKKDLLTSYEYHYGGYWRFDELKDFCYLVNPYFPPKKMMDQFKYFFDTLICEYPSGMRIQKLIAGKMLEIDEEKILVGNGAAELINTLGQIVNGKMALSIPSFNEYVRCFPNCEIKKLYTKNNQFSLSKIELIEASKECDAIAIINPDNPSGSFIKMEDMLEIIQACQNNSTICIIDESFVDFAESDIRYTLIDNEILDKYKNLIVIKSISKSYGVPGIRLGVLASSNLELLAQLKNLLPVWNINSFGEYFLQIFGLYKNSYLDSCNKIADERKWFIEQLNQFSYINAYNSQANYILCKVENTFTSNEVVTNLIAENNILIKDLSTKDGFDKQNYIRIAVKSREDNTFLLEALKKL